MDGMVKPDDAGRAVRKRENPGFFFFLFRGGKTHVYALLSETGDQAPTGITFFFEDPDWGLLYG
jgi:hypothetical protein